jgi:uncharacterized membrane protein YagU involved in acid resistance
MAHAANPERRVLVSNHLVAALLGGLAGGIAFGLLMQVTDIMLSVAALVDSSRTAVGWAVHLGISLLFGMIYALAASHRVQTIGAAAVTGVVYGWFWWILGGLVIMPAWLGREDLIFRFTATAWQSLAGHILYGLLLGLVFGGLLRRVERPAHRLRAAASFPAHRPGDQHSAATPRKRKSAAALLTSSRGITAARHDRRR